MRVIVTGASRGIGAGIARALAGHGCAVGLIARDSARLDEVAGTIRATGGVAEAVPCDLRGPDAAAAAVRELATRLGGLDALINNAGLVIRKDAISLSREEWQAMLDTNVSGVFYAARAALEIMVPQRRGHIINVSSISGKVPLPGGSAYAATKFAVAGFSQSLLQEVRDFGVKVTTIFPGSVDSASHRHDASADPGWKVTPEEVGEACWAALNTRAGNCISEIEIRPLARPPK